MACYIVSKHVNNKKNGIESVEASLKLLHLMESANLTRWMGLVGGVTCTCPVLVQNGIRLLPWGWWVKDNARKEGNTVQMSRTIYLERFALSNNKRRLISQIVISLEEVNQAIYAWSRTF